jgi:hypothetical protein
MPLDNTINSLKNYFNARNGVQRLNRFSIFFLNVPQAAARYLDTEYIAEDFLLNVRAIDHASDNLPGYGAGRLIPRRQRFQEGFTVNFPVTGDNKIMLFFNDWFNSLYSGGSNVGNITTPYNVRYYDEVVKPCKLILNVLNLNGVPVSKFTFNEVFPTETLPITFSSKTQNEYLRYPVTFNFKDYKHERV